MDKFLIFINGRPSKNETNRYQPSFFEALQLLRNPQKLVKGCHYSIPYTTHSNVSFHIHKNNSQFTFNDQTLTLTGDDQKLTEELAYDIFSSIFIRENNKISYLHIGGRNKIKQKTKCSPRTLTKEAEMKTK